MFYGKPLEQIVPMERKELDWSRAEGAEVFSVSNPYTIPELLEILSPIFRANGVRKATLFGSYARGLATARSDVDLLVEDVYKRQPFGLDESWLDVGGSAGLFGDGKEIADTLRTVSYTHLDVYKRQRIG